MSVRLSCADSVVSTARITPARLAAGAISFRASPTYSISPWSSSRCLPKNGSSKTFAFSALAMGMASATQRGPSGSSRHFRPLTCKMSRYSDPIGHLWRLDSAR